MDIVPPLVGTERHPPRRVPQFYVGYAVELLVLLVSSLSLLVAFAGVAWAISTARSAQQQAKEAIEQAHAANQLASESNAIATDSKSIAIDANKISEDALTISRRTELRETDTSNVHWEGDWESPGIYVITNLGDDDAHNVRVILTVDDEKIRVSQETVPGNGGTVKVDCPEARETFIDERRNYQWRRTRGPVSTPGFLQVTAPPQAFEYSTHFIGERIDWVSESGKPGIHQAEYKLASLGDLG